MIARSVASLSFGLALALAISLPMAAEAEGRLHLPWPEHWEVRPAVHRNSVTYLQARQHREGRTVQQLSIAIVDTRHAKQDITLESVRDLALKLKHAALATARDDEIELIPLEHRSGYYFTASRKDRSEDGDLFRQYIEGVILHSGYLISFNLSTDDANSADAKAIIDALDRIEID